MSKLGKILVFEPSTKGHHLVYIHHVCETLIDAGYTVHLAYDNHCPRFHSFFQKRAPKLLEKITLVPIFDEEKTYLHHSALNTLAKLSEDADEVFLINLDAVMSSILRKACFGITPPNSLKGKLSGIYVRPRPLDHWDKGLNQKIKARGFRILEKNQWFKNIFLLDEMLLSKVKEKYTNTLFHFFPDPWEEKPSISQKDAQVALQIPAGKKVFLQYGLGTRRKGIHHVIEAFKTLPENTTAFLLCAGPMDPGEEELSQELKSLEKIGKARVLDYFIESQDEENRLFAASDIILLPYLNHYGSSNVLSRAAANKRPVLGSDYHLVGQRIKTHKLGLTHTHDDLSSLIENIKKLSQESGESLQQFEDSLEKHAQTCSPQALKKAILEAYPSLT